MIVGCYFGMMSGARERPGLHFGEFLFCFFFVLKSSPNMN
jgi:hypothetical protein